MLERLLRALECISNEDRGMVDWSAILRSPYQREELCYFGVFPKILTKEERKKQPEVASKFQAEEEKLARRKEELENAKAHRIE